MIIALWRVWRSNAAATTAVQSLISLKFCFTSLPFLAILLYNVILLTVLTYDVANNMRY
jgi:hypothetical protein